MGECVVTGLQAEYQGKRAVSHSAVPLNSHKGSLSTILDTKSREFRGWGKARPSPASLEVGSAGILQQDGRYLATCL